MHQDERPRKLGCRRAAVRAARLRYPVTGS